MSSASLGIVIPAYNESASLPALLKKLRSLFPEAHLVVVDDSPNEETVQAVESAGLENLSLFQREGKGGRGSAILHGLKHLLQGNTQTLVEMDADFSHNPEELPRLLEKHRQEQLGLLIGSRYLPESAIENWPLSRRLFSRFANAIARFLLRVPVSDYTNGYRLYSREAATCITNTCGEQLKGFILLSEILLTLHRNNFRIGEAPTVFVNRVRGESSVTWKEILHAATGLIRLWLSRLSAPPMAPNA